MGFLDFVLGYAAGVLPLIVAYGLAVRFLTLNPKLLSHLWAAGNLVLLGWLVYRGVGEGGLAWPRSIGYAVGAMITVLAPLIAGVLALASVREESAHGHDGGQDA